MPFRFKKKESVAKGVRRLCHERVDDALTRLGNGAHIDTVHGVRKEIKKLRSVLRLTRGEIRKKTYRRYNDTLHDAADLLTASRDAQVHLHAFDDLTKHFRHKLPARPFPEIRKALLQNCRSEEKHLGHSVPPLKGILCDSKGDLNQLKLKSRGWKAIAPGLKKIYCRGRESFKTARRDPSPENLHEWRKRVKDLWYELRLLWPANPRNLGDRSDYLEKLGKLLGDDHDLFMLKAFAERNFRQPKNKQRFDELIFSRQKKLRSRALKLGRRFYREKPNHFCERIGDYWENWRG
jgi:CHAD domain-containing protein